MLHICSGLGLVSIVTLLSNNSDGNSAQKWTPHAPKWPYQQVGEAEKSLSLTKL